MARNAVFTIISGILLLGNLAAIGASGRERAKRAVCHANLRQLTLAWIAYADENDGKIVNGDAGMFWMGSGEREMPWIARCWGDPYNRDAPLPKETQNEGIRSGALWPYVGETRLYRCPEGHPRQMLSYNIVDSMNGRARAGTSEGGFGLSARGVKVGDTVLWIKKLAEIVSPGPAERMVFIDQGWAWPSSFAVYYTKLAWWDMPPVRHWDGTSVSFADGHCGHWKWLGQETILTGRGRGLDQLPGPYLLPSPEDKEDVRRLQIAVWGRLGYE
jgi:hypothetical protein